LDSEKIDRFYLYLGLGHSLRFKKNIGHMHKSPFGGIGQNTPKVDYRIPEYDIAYRYKFKPHSGLKPG